MIVIPPVDITAAMFTSSTCAEPHATETAYNAGTTYALGAEVVVAADHRTYESLQAGNVGHTPSTSPEWWLDVGATNKWKMIDLLRNTQTVQATPLTVVLTPGVRVDALAVLGVYADSITVTITRGVETIYTHTEELNTRTVLTYFDYFFAPFNVKPSVALFDLPPYADAVITVTLARASGDVSCGSIVIGKQVYLGATQHNAVSGILNFSTITRNSTGDSQLVPRRSAPKTTQTLIARKAILNKIRDARTALNAEPAVWCGHDDSDHEYYEALLILGIYKEFSINLAHDEHVVVNLELEEV